MRIGHGYDVHRLVPGRPLMLGGVHIPWDKGLLGHSDADVLLHAVMDALLGAAALGDIGLHFPPGDERWRDADSLVLLQRVGEMLAQAGYAVVNLDATLLAEAPRLGAYREDMCRCIAKTLRLPRDAVNVKFTTEEGLGFTGIGEGMAAHAVALLERLTP